MITSHRSKNSTAIMMMAIILLNLFIFSPFSLYTTNLEQFTTSLLEVMKLCLIPVLILFLLSIPIINLSVRNTHRISALLAMFSLLVWFQGNVLLWDYGILDGHNINWNDYVSRGWIDGCIWIIALGLVYIFYKNFGEVVIKSAVFILILQLLTLCYTSYENWDLINKKSIKISTEDPSELFKFSRNENILHIVTDGFQSDVFNELLHQEELKDKYQDSFQGFVFYRETLGAFPYTKFSIPAFLAGKMYSNKLPKDVYVDTVLKGHTILSAAYNKKYEIDIASGGNYLINRYSNLPYTNMYNLDNIKSASAEFRDTAVIIDLALFRVSPHFLKKYIYNNQDWLVSKLVKSENIFQFSYFSHTIFLNMFSQAMSIEREEPVYKYVHVMNTHNPMVVDNQCRYAGQATKMNRTTLTIQSRCTLDTLSMLFQKMKDLGVYDRTLIIVHGDHGGWAPNYRQGPPVTFSTGAIARDWLTSLASPLLAIKKPNDKADFRVSDIQASLLDIPDTISDIMNWDTYFNSQSLEKLNLNDNRKRFFRYYDYQKNAHQQDYTGPIHEFSIEGSHYEVEWKPENIFYPPK